MQTMIMVLIMTMMPLLLIYNDCDDYDNADDNEEITSKIKTSTVMSKMAGD